MSMKGVYVCVKGFVYLEVNSIFEGELGVIGIDGLDVAQTGEVLPVTISHGRTEQASN